MPAKTAAEKAAEAEAKAAEDERITLTPPSTDDTDMGEMTDQDAELTEAQKQAMWRSMQQQAGVIAAQPILEDQGPEVYVGMMQVPNDARRERQQARDTTIPGGRYIVMGQVVDCNGMPIEE